VLSNPALLGWVVEPRVPARQRAGPLRLSENEVVFARLPEHGKAVFSCLDGLLLREQAEGF
jgi:hypothetical protein